jgi:peptidoglycan hydrolase CwlO-like protein
LEWKKRNAQLEQEVQNLKNKVTRLETYNETFENKIKDLTDEIVNARHKIAQLEAQNEESQRNIEAQQKEVRYNIHLHRLNNRAKLVKLYN